MKECLDRAATRRRTSPEHAHPRAAPRATTSGAAPHRHQAAAGEQSQRPAYRERRPDRDRGTCRARAPGWIPFAGSLRSIGHESASFAFDNEGPRHQQFVAAFALADRLVTNREYLTFMDDGGYERPEFWLSDGWYARSRNGWTAPLYWESRGRAQVFTLGGMRGLDLDEPVCHVSYYEADAFARWAGARLPTEAEWETSAMAPESPWRGISWSRVDSVRLPDGRPETRPAHRPCSSSATSGNGRQARTALSGIRAGRRSARRVQRQVHVQPDGPAGRVVLRRRDRTSAHLSQLFPARGALAVHRHPACSRLSSLVRRPRRHRGLSNGSSGNDSGGPSGDGRPATRC